MASSLGSLNKSGDSNSNTFLEVSKSNQDLANIDRSFL